MESTDQKVRELRHLLQRRFPQAHPAVPSGSGIHPSVAPPRVAETGVPSSRVPPRRIFETRARLVEIVSASPSSGGGLLRIDLLRRAAREGNFTGLIDPGDRFDPHDLGEAACPWVFWSRCAHLQDAVRIADFLLRDGNLPRILLDLEGASPRELGALSQTVWYRLRSLAERSGNSLIVFTPRQSISAAHQRCSLEQSLPLGALDRPFEDLIAGLQLRATRERIHHHQAETRTA